MSGADTWTLAGERRTGQVRPTQAAPDVSGRASAVVEGLVRPKRPTLLLKIERDRPLNRQRPADVAARGDQPGLTADAERVHPRRRPLRVERTLHAGREQDIVAAQELPHQRREIELTPVQTDRSRYLRRETPDRAR